MEFFTQHTPCLVGMEACGSAHQWARQLMKMGYEVKLMAPQFVKPYVKSNKSDAADAEAICEAVGRPNMRLVAVKTEEQQAVLALHRARQGFVQQRTAQANQIRGLLAEYGVIIPQGIGHISKCLPDILEDPAPFSGTYKVSGQFYAMDNNGNGTITDVWVLKNSGTTTTTLFSGNVNYYSGLTFSSFTNCKTFTMKRGDTLDVEVGFGTDNSYSFDSTGLNSVVEKIK